ncbi:MAG TPA: trypsin-like serine protease [Thermoanaerobaculia bacterium]|jgi:hypothetical protein
MGVPFRQAEEAVESAAEILFDLDPRVRSVGITRHGEAFGYRAVRNSAMIVPLAAIGEPVREVHGVPVLFTDTPGEVESLAAVAASGPASPAASSLVQEVGHHRPLVSGLQIQNFDDDIREGVLDKGLMIVGTLGCFVRLPDGKPGFLSNNHVVAGENRGRPKADRILQPGGGTFDPADLAGILEDFVGLMVSPVGATPKKGNAIFNEVDAGVVRLNAEASFNQGFLPFRNLVAPNGVARAKAEDQVFKVGRTTGLTHGKVTDVAAIVGPIPYDPGPCWFRRSIVIEGLNGTLFSDKGDSGSAIVRTNGEVIGLLYAGNGQQTYACPIEDILSSLHCSFL